MGIMDVFFGPKDSKVDASKAIKAQDEANLKQFEANKGAAGQTFAGYGSSLYGPNGVETKFAGDPNDPTSMAGIQKGMTGNLGLFTGAAGLPDYTGLDTGVLDPNNPVIAARMAGLHTQLSPAYAEQNKLLEQQYANRGIPLSDEISNKGYGNIATAYNDAITRGYGDAVSAAEASRAQAIRNQTDIARAPLDFGGLTLSQMLQQKALIPQANSVTMAGTNAGQYTMDAMKAQDDAARRRQEAIAAAAKMGISLAAAPFTGGASLAMMGGGGMGLFNSGGPSGPGGTYTPQQFQTMWNNAQPSLPWQMNS